jgi:hypothetical protein
MRTYQKHIKIKILIRSSFKKVNTGVKLTVDSSGWGRIPIGPTHWDVIPFAHQPWGSAQGNDGATRHYRVSWRW